MLPVIEETEKAVRHACAILGMRESDARKLTRVEVDFTTARELWDMAKDHIVADIADYRRRAGPMTVYGVSYYVIDELPKPWRVISFGLRVGGMRPSVKITEPE